MKNILITGENSYVGNSVEKWLAQYPDDYVVDKISLRSDKWRKVSFSSYDAILHVAGVAHVSKDPKMEGKYYQINRDLTVEVAVKAKTEGVKQFVFMSSIIVYGDAPGKCGFIDRNTIPKPRDFYGESKLQAEEGILPLSDNTFNVVIIRPPMIYGKNSKGNYPKLSKAAQKLPIFPCFENKRSMLHIDNLSEFVRLMIKNEERGMFFPQNEEYVQTSNMVRTIAAVHNKKVHLTKIFNPILKLMVSKVNVVNKVFGNLVYDIGISEYKEDYNVKNFNCSIVITER